MLNYVNFTYVILDPVTIVSWFYSTITNKLIKVRRKRNWGYSDR